MCRCQLKCDGTREETSFRLSAKWTSPLKSAGASVQSNTGSRGVRISGSNSGYTIFRGSVKGTGYPLHSPVSPSLPLPRVTVCHHISTGVYSIMECAICCLLWLQEICMYVDTNSGYGGARGSLLTAHEMRLYSLVMNLEWQFHVRRNGNVRGYEGLCIPFRLSQLQEDPLWTTSDHKCGRHTVKAQLYLVSATGGSLAVNNNMFRPLYRPYRGRNM